MATKLHRGGPCFALFSLYFTISIGFEALKAQLYSSYHGLELFSYLSMSCVVLEAIMVTLEALSRASSTHNSRQPANSGWPTWLANTIHWLVDLATLGFKDSRTLNDLDDLGAEYSAEHLSQRLAFSWDNGM